MPKTVITVGLGRKRPGREQYSSDSHQLSVTLETEVPTAEEFRACVRALFDDVRAALDEEMARNATPAGRSRGRVDLWAASGDGNGEKPSPTGRADRTAADQISNKQAKYLFQLARRAGMKTQSEVAAWLRDKLGVERGVYELTKVEASRAIDILNDGKGGDRR